MEIIVGRHGILKHSRQAEGYFTMCINLQAKKLFQFYLLGRLQGPNAKIYVFIHDDELSYKPILSFFHVQRLLRITLCGTEKQNNETKKLSTFFLWFLLVSFALPPSSPPLFPPALETCSRGNL